MCKEVAVVHSRPSRQSLPVVWWRHGAWPFIMEIRIKFIVIFSFFLETSPGVQYCLAKKSRGCSCRTGTTQFTIALEYGLFIGYVLTNKPRIDSLVSVVTTENASSHTWILVENSTVLFRNIKWMAKIVRIGCRAAKICVQNGPTGKSPCNCKVGEFLMRNHVPQHTKIQF